MQWVTLRYKPEIHQGREDAPKGSVPPKALNTSWSGRQMLQKLIIVGGDQGQVMV